MESRLFIFISFNDQSKQNSIITGLHGVRLILRWFDTLLVHFFKIDTTSNIFLLAKYVSRLNQESKSGSVASL